MIGSPAAEVVLAHGVSSREDLPIPFSYALAGSVVALVVSFVALGLLWREPRLDRATPGWGVPAGVQRVLDGWAVRGGLAVFGVLGLLYVGLAAYMGSDNALNPTPGVVYVLLWVGVPMLSLLLGPLWRLVNPLRGLHWALTRLVGTRPEGGLAPYPRWLGYWPAAWGLLVFVWLELVAPNNASLGLLRWVIAVYIATNLLAGTYFGSDWFAHGDALEAYSTMMGRLSILGRGGDGRLVLRSPLAGVAGTPVAAGLFAVIGVLLGSTLYDSMSSSPWWNNQVLATPLPPDVTETLGLLGMVALVTAAFVVAALSSDRGLPPGQLVGEFSHSLIPIVAGYIVAHYWSLLVLVGQQTITLLSDPLGTGDANWLGTRDLPINDTLADPGFVAVLQVGVIVVGHVLGVVLAHDRALRLLPRRRAIRGQLPMLVLMVGYTVGGLSLLFAA